MKKLLVFLCILSICGAATLASAGETRGIGYWKNHDTERETLITGAVEQSAVYGIGAESSMRYYLSLKGKKTMEEHAKRQLAALLLNVAGGLKSSTWLSQGELDIIQIIDPALGEGTEIGDALTVIENEINGLGDMESAKDLAEEINGRGVYY